jgi:leader peptidase (prepilin peptidase)/N-methyltransferase
MPALPIIFILLASPFIGSFLGLLAVRLPAGQQVVAGRSACPQCGATLRAKHLVPVLSFLLLRGACRDCGGRISPLYPAVELACVAIAIVAACVSSGWPLAVNFALGCWLLVLSAIDARHFWLPDVLTLPLIPAGLLLCWLTTPNDLLGHAIGATAGYALFWSIAKLYFWARGVDGLGLGDAKLLAGLGAFVSWTGLPAIIAIASLAGLAFAAGRAIIAGQKLDGGSKIPFGPFLAFAGWLVWLLRDIAPVAGW